MGRLEDIAFCVMLVSFIVTALAFNALVVAVLVKLVSS